MFGLTAGVSIDTYSQDGNLRLISLDYRNADKVQYEYNGGDRIVKDTREDGNILTSTGQSFIGNNMFAYCGNNPVNRLDPSGNFFKPIRNWFNEMVDKTERKFNKLVDFITNDDEQAVLNAEDFAFYKGVPVIKVPFMGNSAFSFGIIFMGSDGDKNLVKHEYGHTVHLRQIGLSNYIKKVVVPSVISYWNPNQKGDYYSQPWEFIADYFGKAIRADHVYEANAQRNATWYWYYTLLPY